MKVLVLDVETTVQRRDGIIDGSPFDENNRLVSVHFKWLESPITSLVFHHKEKQSPDDPTPFKEALNEADVIVAHNAKFDIQWLIESGFKISSKQKVYCTMIGEYIFLRGQTKHSKSLANTAERRKVSRKKSELIDELFKEGMGFEEIPLPTVIEYAEADVQSCAEIYVSQQKELKEQKRKSKELKAFKEEEERKKQLEYIKIKEWEDKFDKHQKEKEIQENRKEFKLRQLDLQRNKEQDILEDDSDNLTLGLEKIDIDKFTKN